VPPLARLERAGNGHSRPAAQSEVPTPLHHRRLDRLQQRREAADIRLMNSSSSPVAGFVTNLVLAV